MNHELLLAKQEKLIITQANALACSAQSMTLLEKRLLLLTMSQIRKDDDKFKLYQLPVATIREKLGLTHTGIHSHLKEIADKLLSRVVTVEDDKGNWSKFQWVSKCRYYHQKNSNEACIEIKLHEELHPLLLNLQKHFGSIPLLQIASMPSVHSIRILEILWFSSMQLIKKELVLSLEDLKKQLGVSENYKNFAFFRRDVLERAQRDCAKHTLLSFTWKPEKKGRKVVNIRFFLQSNKKNNLEAPPIKEIPQIAPSTENPLMTMLIQHGVAKKEAQKLLDEFPKERIQHNIELVRQKFAAGKVKQTALAPYTVNAIREDWYGAVSKVEVKKAVPNKEEKEKIINACPFCDEVGFLRFTNKTSGISYSAKCDHDDKKIRQTTSRKNYFLDSAREGYKEFMSEDDVPF